jgi:hypothetical protein
MPAQPSDRACGATARLMTGHAGFAERSVAMRKNRRTKIPENQTTLFLGSLVLWFLVFVFRS